MEAQDGVYEVDSESRAINVILQFPSGTQGGTIDSVSPHGTHGGTAGPSLSLRRMNIRQVRGWGFDSKWAAQKAYKAEVDIQY